MYLKKNINAVAFLNTIRDQCRGDVSCRTQEGDTLNLRSTLCKYIFAVVSNDQKLMQHCVVTCENPEDLEVLSPFLMEEEEDK